MFDGDGEVRLPVAYNHGLQGALYGLLSEEFRVFLHERGFNINGRRFKLFTFSRLFGRFVRYGGMLKYDGELRLCVSSPVERFIRELANSLISKGCITLLGNKLTVKSIHFPAKPTLKNNMTFKTLSPITVYSTLTTRDGRKKTYYYSPFEDEFTELIAKNLVKKAELINGSKADGNLSIEFIGKPREVICLHKGTVIRAWVGRLKIQGDPHLMEAGYDAGVGGKNSAGFGMIEVSENDRSSG